MDRDTGTECEPTSPTPAATATATPTSTATATPTSTATATPTSTATATPTSTATATRCTDAFTSDELLNNTAKLDQFFACFIKAEASFETPGIGYNAPTGITYDGQPIDNDTGQILGKPRLYTAASKEALHTTVLVLAIAGNSRARLFVSPDDPSRASQIALDILTRKISTYETFARLYPAFGYFIPWVEVRDTGIAPAPGASTSPEGDWRNRIPGLDNGQLAWAMVLASDVLEGQGQPALAARYRAYWLKLAEHAVAIFYDPDENRIRAEARIISTTLPTVVASNYSNNQPGYFLDDPYEGELLLAFMDLFGSWPDRGKLDQIWQAKRLTRVNYVRQDGRQQTVRQGHWFSPHELWNFLVLPYSDVQLVQRLFLNGEKARTINAAENNLPGLNVSTNCPKPDNSTPFTYCSNQGVPSIAYTTTVQTVVSPYAAFSVIQANPAIGAAWLRAMLLGPRMQGPLGATESITLDGSQIAPVKTQDATLLPIIAIAGESPDLMRRALVRLGVYEAFISRVTTKYTSVFGARPIEGEDLPFTAPTTQVPAGAPDFRPLTSVEVLNGSEFNGQGELWASTTFDKATRTLSLGQGSGFVWNYIVRVDARAFPYITFLVRSGGSSLSVEVKNTQIPDRPITGSRLAVAFPDTAGAFVKYTIAIRELITDSDTRAAVFVYLNTSAPVAIRGTTLTKEAPLDSTALIRNGNSFSPPR